MNLRIPKLEQVLIREKIKKSFYKRPSPPPIPDDVKPRPEKQPDIFYQANLVYAQMVTKTLADPDADPFIRDIFTEHFTERQPEPELVHPGMMELPVNDSGLNHLHNYPTAGIQNMVYKLTAETKKQPFPNAKLYDTILQIQEEAKAYDETPRLTAKNMVRYRFSAHGTYNTEQLQDMLLDIARENR